MDVLFQSDQVSNLTAGYIGLSISLWSQQQSMSVGRIDLKRDGNVFKT